MGKNVKTFFKYFVQSLLPQPPFYSRLLRTSLSDSIIYFLFLIFFLNFIFFFSFLVKNEVVGSKGIHKSAVKVLRSFPQDLKIFIIDGTVLTTYDRPYLVWTDHNNKKKLVAVVDESADPKMIKDYSSLLLLTKSHLVVNQDKIPVQKPVMSLSTIDLTIDHTTAMFLGNVIEKYFPLLFLFFTIVSIFIVPFFSTVANLITVFFVSLLAHWLFSLYSKGHKFKKTFQFTLHSSTLPIAVYYMLALYGASTSEFRLASYLLLLLFSICALYEGHLDPPHSIKSRHASIQRK